MKRSFRIAILAVVAALALSAAVSAAGCSGGSRRHDLPPTDAADLASTLDDLAAFGPKHAGTASNDAAADYIRTRMENAGLTDVHLETFSFPRWVAGTAGLAVSIDGTARVMSFDVFEASGSGHVTGPVVFCDDASPDALASLDLTGKIAMVKRVLVPHRAAQLRNVHAKGATAMLYESVAPDDLPQVGSVRFTWESTAAIPAFTLGADDAGAIETALANGQPVTATLDASVSVVPGTGHDVVGTLPGSDPAAGTIVVGAHYDSWFAGSVDNGGGVAAVLALAERLSARGTPRATLVFVAYDGEELGLYGGYAWLRKHVITDGEPVRAVFNFEVPSSLDSTVNALGRSPDPGVVDPTDASGLKHLYTLVADMSVVPQIFGGIIPTDVQGFYRAHVPTASTAADSLYYHTSEDTPDKVDTPFLAQVVDDFDDAIRLAEDHPATDFQTVDPQLWNASVMLAPRSPGDPLVADVTVTDAAGLPQAGAPVDAALLVDDFTLAGELAAMTDSAGHATFAFPAAAAESGSGSRWLHVTSGPEYPLVESITPLP